MKRTLLVMGLVIGVALIIVACTPAAAPTTEATACPEQAPCPAATAAEKAPFQDAWAASGHADKAAAAFTHWNEDDPKEIPVFCAKCHSSDGFVDFVGADGSEAMKVDKAAAIGTVITCNTCHNEGTAKLSTVMFPSGAELKGLGGEAVCMTCHQGMASKVQVDEQIAKFNATDPDAVVAPMKEGDQDVAFGFVNVHYFAAAATLYGTEVKGGYEYEGKAYDAKFDHVEGYATCVQCHNSHSLEVKVAECAFCHEGVTTAEDLKKIRMVSSAPDYDGDGDVTEGMATEIEGLQAALYTAMQAYSTETAGSPLVYSKAAYPYFFIDTNADGKTDDAEAVFPNSYKSWTPRLLKAAYNYQVSVKDPGAYAHGNKYIVQLLTDSIEDLNAKLSKPVDMTGMHRDDNGHFAGNSLAFRDWDETGAVPVACVKCHTAEGMPMFLKNNATISIAPSNGFQCSSCHNEAEWPAIYAIKEVSFPSGKKLSFAEGDPNNICLQCHQGRQSTVSVNNAVAGKPVDNVDDKLSFLNVHYFAAGATLFGTEAKGMYEYEGKEYAGAFQHAGALPTCTSCHDAHKLAIDPASCKGCHQTEDPGAIRGKDSQVDYDGDGDVAEGLKGEVETMAEKLYAEIAKYAEAKGAAILYDAHSHPYYFFDKDKDGKADTDEKGKLAYKAWTPKLLEAAYNYQYAMKDTGGYAHNAKYILQGLYDSIQSLGGSVAGMTRP